MKFVLALLIIVPTLIAILLFYVAGFAYASPAMLDAAINPTVAVLCIIAGIIALLPLIAIDSRYKNKLQSDSQIY